MKNFRSFTIILLVLVSSILCKGQGVLITTQAEMDAFDSSTTIIYQNLSIEGNENNVDPIVNLNNLSNLTSIGGYLNIGGNDALMNLDGLSNLTSIGGYLNIYFNESLTNLDGLSNLISIGGDLDITDNVVLPNVDGLSSLASIGGDLDIYFNESLTNLDGLSNLTSVNNMYISHNNSLGNIDGLSSLTSTSGELYIEYNDVLMNIDGLSNLTSTGGRLQIHSNPSLVNLDGLSNLTSVSGYLSLASNDALTNLDGLSNLTFVSGHHLTIYYNPSLTNCCGIQNLLNTGAIVNINIVGNPSECSSENEITNANCACSAPLNVQHTLQAPANIFISWDAHLAAARYDVFYRVQGTSEWTRVVSGIGASNRTINNLAPDTWYQYRVRTLCDNDTGGLVYDFANATGFRYFNTVNTPLEREGFVSTATDIINLYPNPTSKVLHVEFFTINLSDVNFLILDMTGKTVMEQTVVNVDGFQKRTLDISDLGIGYYMIVITSDNQRVVKKFAKME